MRQGFDNPGAVTVTETGLGQFQVEVVAGGAAFLADEPVEAGGMGSGPNPYDLLCAALGACTTMTLRLYAGRKRWPLEHTTVRVLHSHGARRPRPLHARGHLGRPPRRDTAAAVAGDRPALSGPPDAGRRGRHLHLAGAAPSA